MNITDNEYLSNEEIPNVLYEITNNKIRISTESTIFVEIFKPQHTVSLEETKMIFKKIRQICKQKNISISNKNHYKKTIEDKFIEYTETIDYLEKEFEKAVELTKQVEQRKLHYGTVDDKVLIQLQECSHIFQRANYRDKAYSQVTEIYYRMEDLLQNIQEDYKHYTKIFI